ncbi:MAG: hypothetical protein R2867_14185 [Caldilineaceae bacterium]
MLESRGSVIYATLILLLVSLPILFMQGLSGLFFNPLITAYLIAIPDLTCRGASAYRV